MMLLTPGTQLGHYEIHAPLGAGGMGEVYRARDARLQRDVAIKILPEHLSTNPVAMKRFEREARALASLSHPNILPIHDFGFENGILFAVMDFLEGSTLRAFLLKNGVLPWPKTIEIAVAVADGLSAAHDKGIIHRDLKPENIFITKNDRVIILDFGLARFEPLQPQSDGSLVPTRSLETEAGTLMGTVPYMSPEQLQGSVVDARTDIFSFGCVLYEMLTGRSAFARNTSAETVAAILKEEPAEFSRFDSNVPDELEAITRRCLEKDREKRIHSSHDLGLMLRQLSASSTVVKQRALRRRTLPSWLWLILLSLFLFSAAYLWMQSSKPAKAVPIRSLAVLPLKNLSAAEEEEYFAEGMTEAIIAHLAKIRALKVISSTSVMQFKEGQKPIRLIGEELQVDALIEGSVLHSGNRVRITAQLIDARSDQHLWTETYERSIEDVLSLQSEIASDIAQQIRIEITSEEQVRLGSKRIVNPQAYESYLKGRYFWNKRSPAGMKKAVEYFRKGLDLDPTYAPAYVGLADCYIVQGGQLLGLSGKEAYAKAKSAITKALEIDETLAEAHTSLGSIKGEYDHDWKAAEKEYLRAIELKPNYATAHQWYSDFLVINGRLEEALSEAERAIEIDPLSLVNNTSLAIRFYGLRRYDEAIAQFQRTLEMDPNFFTAHFFLGRTYLQKGMNREALQSFEKSGATAYVGYTHAISGRKEEAKRILHLLLEKSAQQYVNPFDFAVLYLGLGDQEEALRWLEKAYEDNVEGILFLKVDPLLEPIRSEPRFLNLLRGLNLE